MTILFYQYLLKVNQVMAYENNKRSDDAVQAWNIGNMSPPVLTESQSSEEL